MRITDDTLWRKIVDDWIKRNARALRTVDTVIKARDRLNVG